MPSDIQPAARRALALNALANAVLAQQKAARVVAYNLLADAGVRGPVDVCDDDQTDLGTVSRTKGRATARITDPEAYGKWVAERYPDRVKLVPTVDAGFTERLLSTAAKLVDPVDTETGEVVPGIDVSEGEPGITVRPNAEAKARMAALLAEAGLALPSAEEAGG